MTPDSCCSLNFLCGLSARAAARSHSLKELRGTSVRATVRFPVRAAGRSFWLSELKGCNCTFLYETQEFKGAIFYANYATGATWTSHRPPMPQGKRAPQRLLGASPRARPCGQGRRCLLSRDHKKLQERRPSAVAVPAGRRGQAPMRKQRTVLSRRAHGVVASHPLGLAMLKEHDVYVAADALSFQGPDCLRGHACCSHRCDRKKPVREQPLTVPCGQLSGSYN